MGGTELRRLERRALQRAQRPFERAEGSVDIAQRQVGEGIDEVGGEADLDIVARKMEIRQSNRLVSMPREVEKLRTSDICPRART